MSEFDGSTYFFMHIMKTAGTSLVSTLRPNFAVDEVYPAVDGRRTVAMGDYWKVDDLRKALPEARGRVRFYCGHLPYAVRELIGATVVFTLLRDPVDRVASHLRHCARHFERYEGKRLEEIYEDPWHRPCLFTNYQVKQFALPLTDDLKAHIDILEIGQAEMDRALERLHDVEVLGLAARYEEFVDELTRSFGWTRFDKRRLQVSPGGDTEIPASLRRRIRADNEADLEFYARAVELVGARSRGRIS